jgi:hypothetical protein
MNTQCGLKPHKWASRRSQLGAHFYLLLTQHLSQIEAFDADTKLPMKKRSTEETCTMALDIVHYLLCTEDENATLFIFSASQNLCTN